MPAPIVTIDWKDMHYLKQALKDAYAYNEDCIQQAPLGAAGDEEVNERLMYRAALQRIQEYLASWQER